MTIGYGNRMSERGNDPERPRRRVVSRASAHPEKADRIRRYVPRWVDDSQGSAAGLPLPPLDRVYYRDRRQDGG